MRTLAALLVLFTVIGCAATKQSERVSAADLGELVPGAKLKGMVANGDFFEGTYFRDGTMAIRTGGDADTGTWEFEDDTICLNWKKWRDGKRYCIYWERDRDGYASYFTDGKLSTRFTIVE